MFDLPKVKNYEVKNRVKNHAKATISDKTIYFKFSKVRKITKINCPELSTVTCTFTVDFHGWLSWLSRFQKESRRGRELILYNEVCLVLIFYIPTVALWTA